ncbi:MAG: NADH-quinone oxidoreductase subunit C [Candidatus Omnitrophica bacterium]|nr:NADH-quinone oxidoreductase subunit C [Candidatus Omnitrophota bacterium]
MNISEIKSKIESALPGVSVKIVSQSLLVEKPGNLTRVVRYLKDSPEFRMDYLASVTGADYLDYLESVYHLYSMAKKTGPIVLRVRVRRDEPKIPSLARIYRGAEFQEREAYDLFGILYENHPDLRRLFLWEGFEGFPLRKDYLQEDSEILEAEDIQWLEEHGIPIPEDIRKQAHELKQQGLRALAQKPTKESGV